MEEDHSESRAALRELIALLQEIDARFLGPDWGLTTPADVAGGTRAFMHILQGGVFTHFEDDPQHPQFLRIVSPTRKFTGDNADAIYFEAPVDPQLAYRIRGNTGGAVYTSLTIEAGGDQGDPEARTAGVLNDENFDIAPNGDFEITLGGPSQESNWLALSDDARRVTSRHYFENKRAAAADPHIPIRIEIAPVTPSAPPPVPDDAEVAAGLRRVNHFVRSRTLEMPPPGQREQPPFVSTTPNDFPEPIKPGDFALAAADAAYSMAPYVLGPDEALEITGRWPECRCANVSLWNRHMQTYDYSNRQVSLNRAQTQLEPDGRLRMLLAHRDPGAPNWLDTEGRPFGMVFWRFMLPEGSIEKPETRVIPFDALAAG
ncbi:MAG: hypothetical protein VCC04_14960 [Myxococcota bacterium]